MMADPFDGIWRRRRVLVTGHTGFKGSWLCHWLLRMGAQVSGISLAPSGSTNLFRLLGLEARLDHRLIDIRHADELMDAVSVIRPEAVFHLAAQPLVREAYRSPKATFDINVGGSVNLLEAIRGCDAVRAAVFVTTDKVYENREWAWGYRESDHLGGHDPYSSSKAATELAVASWRNSYFSRGPALASVRAGNVIGGGDWSPERIATDVLAACATDGVVHLRNPVATRPWQHVLEPLSAYLLLGARLLGPNATTYAQAWNVGPNDSDVVTVEHLARLMISSWGAGRVETNSTSDQPHEAGLLKLDSSKTRAGLAWHGSWNVAEAAHRTVAWHRAHLSGEDCTRISDMQIDDYISAAKRSGQPWAGA